MSTSLARLSALLGSAVLVVSALGGCATTGDAGTPAPAVTVRLIAFNDFHGHLESTGLALSWPDPQDPSRTRRLASGGAAPLGGLVDALRAGARHHVTLSSGDMVGATPLVSALFRHESTIDIANRIGVELAVPGNHEFDAGTDELLRLLRGGCAAPDTGSGTGTGSVTLSCPLGRFEGARFTTFAANVERVSGGTLFPPSVVRRFDGIPVGFIGAVLRGTPGIVVPSGVAGLKFTDEADALNAEARRLRAQGVEALVAVIHEGGEVGAPNRPMAWNAPCENPRGPIFDIVRRLDPAIDLVLSAHTHQGYLCQVDGRAVMQATALGRGVSAVDLVIDRRTADVDRARSAYRNLPVFNESTDPALREAITASEPAPWAQILREARPSPALAARVAEYVAAAAPRTRQPVGRIAGTFDRASRTDAPAGRLIADAQWAATRASDAGGAQVALMNPGGVRTDLRCIAAPACEITYGDLFAMQPFGNSLVVMSLTGTELRQLLEDQQRPGRTTPHFLIPSSSLRYAWDGLAPYGQRVRDLRLEGRLIAPEDTVRLTVNSFLAEGGDGVTMLRNGRERTGGPLDLDALVAYLAASPRSPDPTPRIRWID